MTKEMNRVELALEMLAKKAVKENDLVEVALLREVINDLEPIFKKVEAM